MTPYTEFRFAPPRLFSVYSTNLSHTNPEQTHTYSQSNSKHLHPCQNATPTELWSTDGNRAMFLTLVFHSLHQPTTGGCPFKLISTLKLIRLSVLSSCLHPSSPTAADEGRLRAKAQIPPASYSPTCPSLSATFSLYLSPYNSKLISFHLPPG